MKLRLRLAAATSAMVLAAGFALVFTAGPASATDGLYWVSAAGHGDLWWNSAANASEEPDGAFQSSHSDKTPLAPIEISSTATTCDSLDAALDGGVCQWQLPDGECMAWDQDAGSSSNLVYELPCEGLQSEQWQVTEVGDSDEYALLNDYATIVDPQCGSDSEGDVIDAPKSGADVSLSCSLGTDESFTYTIDS